MSEKEKRLREDVASLKVQIEKLKAQQFELKAMKETLTAEKERAQKYLDVAAVILIVIDADRKISLINKKGCEILGGTEDLIIGRDWFENFLLKEEKDRVAATFKKLISGQEKNVSYYENSVVNFKRETRLIAWHNAPLKNEKGDIVAVLSSGEDITERRKIEANLAESEKRYRMLFDAAPIVIAITTPAGDALAVNNAITELSGYTPEEFMVKNMNDVYVDPDDRKRILALFQKEGRVRNFETRFKIKDHSVISVLVNTDAIEFGNQKMILATVRDISEHKKAAEALKKQKEALEQKNVALSEILVQIEIEKNKIKRQIAANVDELILPIVRKLLKKGVSRKNIQLLEHNLKSLTDSFGLTITGSRVSLTPKEIEICDMIKNGFSGKDIAGTLNISLLTVNKHRRNIREKLGISNKEINLTSFLRKL